MEQSRMAFGGEPRPVTGTDVLEFLMKGRAFVALIIVVAIFAILVPGLLELNSVIVMATHVAGVALMAIGVTFVILSGGIDLSVGSIVGVTGMIAGGLINEGIRLPFLGIVLFPKIWMVILLTLLFGIMLGAINGLVITRLKVAPFIATLGMLYAARGLAGLRNNGYTFPNLVGNEAIGNQGFSEIGSGTFINFTERIGIPWPIWIMVLFAVAAYYVTKKLPFGRHVYALGGNRRVAQLSGVRVELTETMVYVISGFCSAMVGLILTSRLVAAHPMNGFGYELTAIAA
ncbi:MAG: ABC transporter permease, partial [Spirochaetota bacterium]